VITLNQVRFLISHQHGSTLPTWAIFEGGWVTSIAH